MKQEQRSVTLSGQPRNLASSTRVPRKRDREAVVNIDFNSGVAHEKNVVDIQTDC